MRLGVAFMGSDTTAEIPDCISEWFKDNEIKITAFSSCGNVSYGLINSEISFLKMFKEFRFDKIRKPVSIVFKDMQNNMDVIFSNCVSIKNDRIVSYHSIGISKLFKVCFPYKNFKKTKFKEHILYAKNDNINGILCANTLMGCDRTVVFNIKDSKEQFITFDRTSKKSMIITMNIDQESENIKMKKTIQRLIQEKIYEIYDFIFF
ncbi:MAG: hypothetical protein K0R90_540 [Oscillospiraceae bacterium]|jgi:hypothetical protein|nr:hypothetical protein [Oscillospiraceae bacterium]